MAISREAAKRDLRKVLIAARSIDAPLIVGSAGSAGQLRTLPRRLRSSGKLHRKRISDSGLLHAADISRDEIRAAIVDGRISPMDGMAPLSDHALGNSTHVVAQMGLEMIQKALLEGADVVIAGRACDTGIFAALPILLGFPAGLAIHLAKIVECASLCCVPGGRDAILATLDADGFELESINPHRAATPASVAAHSLYEQADPYSIYEPCGRVDLRSVIYGG